MTVGSMGAGRAVVVLVHGVGFDGELFGSVAEILAAAGVEPVVVCRRGYDGRPPDADLDHHLDDLAAILDPAPDSSVVMAGVSGGATLALALARRGHPALASVVAHEPLVGPSAPEQHARISASLTTLSQQPGGRGVEAFLRRLVTDETWDRIDPDIRARARARDETVRAETVGFGAFTLSSRDLGGLAAPLTWTVGRRSPGWRHQAAAMADGAGVAVATLDAGHTPQLEDPEGFARLILTQEESSER